jgi:NitT/TauT family transport system ATP-binding protein
MRKRGRPVAETTAAPTNDEAPVGNGRTAFATAKVRVHEVSKDFGAGAVGVKALDQVSFEVRDGEFIALTGRSGCGKTTMLRVLMGLESVSSGHVEVDGSRVVRPGQDRAMVFQHAQLLPWRDVYRNVTFGLEAASATKQLQRERADKYLELVGLSRHAKLRPAQLSGGMQQRVGLARALAIEPKVLLMDEPFGALDAQTRENLQQALLEIHARTKKTIIFVTHDLDEAVLLADRVVVMSPSPGRVKEIVDINIPRPRTDVMAVRLSEEFLNKRLHLWTLLKETQHQ